MLKKQSPLTALLITAASLLFSGCISDFSPVSPEPITPVYSSTIASENLKAALIVRDNTLDYQTAGSRENIENLTLTFELTTDAIESENLEISKLEFYETPPPAKYVSLSEGEELYFEVGSLKIQPKFEARLTDPFLARSSLRADFHVFFDSVNHPEIFTALDNTGEINAIFTRKTGEVLKISVSFPGRNSTQVSNTINADFDPTSNAIYVSNNLLQLSNIVISESLRLSMNTMDKPYDIENGVYGHPNPSPEMANSTSLYKETLAGCFSNQLIFTPESTSYEILAGELNYACPTEETSYLYYTLKPDVISFESDFTPHTSSASQELIYNYFSVHEINRR